MAIFWFTTEDELLGNNPIDTVICEPLRGIGTVWFERFDDGRVGGKVEDVFWPTADVTLLGNIPTEAVACVLFGSIE